MKDIISITYLIIIVLGLVSQSQAKKLNDRNSFKEFQDLEPDSEPKFTYWIEGFGRNGFTKYPDSDFVSDENLFPMVLKKTIKSPKPKPKPKPKLFNTIKDQKKSKGLETNEY